MTTPPSDKDALVQEMLAAVRELDSHVQATAETVAVLATETKANTEAEVRLERSQRRHRFWILLTIVGLALDLALSGLFVYQHYQQDCTNSALRQRQSINQRNFRAEVDKVAGQVAGLKKIRSAGANQAQAFAGFDQFIEASETYLVTIGKINDDLKKHPLGTC